MNKLLMAALAASVMSIASAATAAEVEDSRIDDTIIAEIDADFDTDLTHVDYTDDSLDVSGNDLLSNNRTITATSTDVDLEVDRSVTRVSHDTNIRADIDVRDNDGFNDISMRTDDVTAVNVGNTIAAYAYVPDNTPFASHQNDFGELHKISVSAVGAMAGPSISVGRAVER